MNLDDEIDIHQNIVLDESENMNEQQQAIFLNISRSRSVDSIFNKLLPHPNQIPDRERTLVWEPIQQPQLTNNIIINNHLLNFKQPQKAYIKIQEENNGLKVFKSLKKPKVKTKCDYDKNICGYITKKVIRQFIGKNYVKQIRAFMEKYQCRYDDCKSFYLKKIQVVTGPSHLNELFNPVPQEPEKLRRCKKAFKEFYIWFLKYRYLRYLIHQGKMTNKLAYIEYKNNYLFRYILQKSEQTSQKSSEILKLQQQQLQKNYINQPIKQEWMQKQ